MSDLNGVIGELRMVLNITRAATGKTEMVELVGKSVVGDPADGVIGEINVKEQENGSNPLDCGS